MGCSSNREKIEDQIMQLKLVKMEIQMERENNINLLSEIAGHKINYQGVPDYIDPEFAIKNRIFFGTSPEIMKKYETNQNETAKNTKKKKIIKKKKKKAE